MPAQSLKASSHIYGFITQGTSASSYVLLEICIASELCQIFTHMQWKNTGIC